MPSKSAAGAKKKPAVKARPLKEIAVKEAATKEATAKSSARGRKAASGKLAMRGKENRLAMDAPPASVASSVSASALNEGPTMPTPAVADAEDVQDPSAGPAASDTVPTYSPEERDADIAILRAQLISARHELQVVRAREAERGSSSKVQASVQRPHKVGNLQKAMNVTKDQYHDFILDVSLNAITARLDPMIHWSRQDSDKLALVAHMTKKKHIFLKRFIGDWPIKEYLKRHFSNQRSYVRRVRRAKAAAAAKGKGKGKPVGGDTDQEEWYSGIDTNDENSDEGEGN